MGKQQKPQQTERKESPKNFAHSTANKERKAATRAARLLKAALRRASNDVCIPGTNTKAKPQACAAAILSRAEQAERISKKQETRRRLAKMTPKQRAEARENGRRQFHRQEA